MDVVHPLTGEVLPDDLDTLAVLEEQVDGYLRAQRAHYTFRRRLRERIAELRGIANVPPMRFRTQKQHRVACCPRCGYGESPDAEIERGPDNEENPFHEAA